MTAIARDLRSPVCNQCGSKLVLLSKKTEKIEGSRSPITINIYKCSDKKCQEEIDKTTNKRLKLQKEQEQARQNRINLRNSQHSKTKNKSN